MNRLTFTQVSRFLHSKFAPRARRQATPSLRKPSVIEPLEGRIAPAVTFAFVAGNLSVSSTFNDTIAVSRLGADAAVNGIDTGIPVAIVTSLSINPNAGDGPGDNLIDLSNVTLGAAGFPSLLSETVNGQGGNDTIVFDFTTGVQIPVNGITVDGGSGLDHMRINEGFSALNPIVSNVHYDFTGAASIYEFTSGAARTITDPSDSVEDVADHVVADARTIDFASGTNTKLADNGDPTDNVARVTFPNVPAFINDFVMPVSTLTLTGGAAANTITFGALDQGGLTPTVAVNGGASGDQFVFDFAGGNPMPAGGLNLNGGGGADVVSLKNGTASNVLYDFTNAAARVISIDGRTITSATAVTIDNKLASANISFVSDGSAGATVDLGAHALSGGGITGTISFLGSSVVNLDAGNQQMTATGTTQNDNIVYTPTGATAGTFYDDLPSGNNAVPNTIFNISNVSGNFLVFNDPGGSADQVTIQGTAARDLIEINQGSGVAQVLSNNVTALLPVTLGISVEILNARGLGGQNTFQVIPAPGIAGQAQDNLLVNVDGGTTGANNALIVGSSFGATPGTLGANVFALVNKSATANTGSVRVFTNAVANPDINYENVKVVSPKMAGTSADPNLLVIGPDLNEANDLLGTATFLGSSSSFAIQHATIFPNDAEFVGAPADNDFYRVVAQSTGKLDFQVSYRTVNPALLPGGGNLSLEVLDSSGNVIGTGTTNVSVLVAAGQSYFLHVSGTTANVINGYDATIINTGAGGSGGGGGGFGNPGNNSNAFTTSHIYDLDLPASGAKGKGPSAVATGDLDGDGFADVVTANAKTKTLSILINQGDGTFFDPVNISTGKAAPQDIVIADFDGVAGLDLVVTNPGSGSIAFFHGNNNGTFNAPTLTLTPKFKPYALAFGEMDGMAGLDLVVTSRATSAIEVIHGNNNGTFAPGTPIKMAGKLPNDVVVADINGNGDLDVATANFGSNNISFFAGNGAGGLGPEARFSAGVKPTSLAVADLDNDGNLDLAVSNFTSRFVSVFLGNGNVAPTVQFAPQLRVAVPGALRESVAIVVGDFDGNGIADIGLGNYLSTNFTVLLGTGLGGAAAYTQPYEFDLGKNPRFQVTGGIAAADLNNDGLLDLIATSFQSNDVRVLLRNV